MKNKMRKKEPDDSMTMLAFKMLAAVIVYIIVAVAVFSNIP